MRIIFYHTSTNYVLKVESKITIRKIKSYQLAAKDMRTREDSAQFQTTWRQLWIKKEPLFLSFKNFF